jgi:hypothetical protein
LATGVTGVVFLISTIPAMVCSPHLDSTENYSCTKANQFQS